MSAGHNSGVIGTELDSFLQRIERLTDEKAVQAAEYAEAISEVWAEAKSRGYDKKAMKEALRLRAMDNDTRAMIHLYANVLDIFS